MMSYMKYLKYLIILAIFVLGIFVGNILQSKKQPTINTQQTLTSLDEQPLPNTWKTNENQPGNSFATAVKIQSGYETQGTLNPGNILDYYTFDLSQPADIIVTVTDVPKQFGFILYDGNYNEIAHTFRSGSTEGTTKINVPTAGKYYLKVFGNYKEIVNVPYTIRYSVLPISE